MIYKYGPNKPEKFDLEKWESLKLANRALLITEEDCIEQTCCLGRLKPTFILVNRNGDSCYGMRLKTEPQWPPGEAALCLQASKDMEEQGMPLSPTSLGHTVSRTYMITNCDSDGFAILHAYKTARSLFCSFSQ